MRATFPVGIASSWTVSSRLLRLIFVGLAARPGPGVPHHGSAGAEA
jgi:hypothetical protein